MQTADVFHLIVAISARTPADIEPIADALARMRPTCLAEPGCLAWEAYHSADAAEKFYLVETWASRAAWEAHGELSAIQDIYVPEIMPRINREVHPCSRIG
ncbi:MULTISPECIES: putative quinol monooxygenase [Chromobacterium]|uniref:putative quinol monooxygenase n=1 Tax=Chromobacterium TaxID=535 RepID=UPI000AF8056C|nr:MULTISPECIES: antibiotic biosynthesis monooxygenase [Chromobacterium]WSE91703.1 antibiotic biosynthesis monooxygenase [Chromobacterium subtsugae]WVH60078.1 antibiotic biosynthesis monooxygenase [Chromobacterium subtsugae]